MRFYVICNPRRYKLDDFDVVANAKAQMRNGRSLRNETVYLLQRTEAK